MEFTGERYVPCAVTNGQIIEMEHWQRYLAVKKLIKPTDIVLDIASGEGYGSDFLAQTAAHVYGVDIAHEAIEHANKTYRRPNLEFLQGSVTDIPLKDHSVSVVVSFETIEHVGQTDQVCYLHEIKRILKEDGVLIVSCPNKAIASDFAYEMWKYVNEFHIKEYYVTEFKEFLSQHFPFVEFLYQRSEQSLIMNEPSAQTLEIMWAEKRVYDDVQNIIAVCSSAYVDISQLNCIMMDNNKLYVSQQRTLASLLSQHNESSKRLELLIEENRLKDDSIDSAQQALEEQKLQINDLVAAATSERIRLSEQLIDAESERLRLSEQLINAENERIRWSEQLIEAENEHLHLCEQLHSIEKENNQLCEKVTGQFAEIERLRIIENSTIWRTSAPLRRVLDGIKGVKKIKH